MNQSLQLYTLLSPVELTIVAASLLVGTPTVVTGMFQQVLNVAARVVTNTRKYDRDLHHTIRHELQIRWMDLRKKQHLCSHAIFTLNESVKVFYEKW